MLPILVQYSLLRLCTGLIDLLFRIYPNTATVCLLPREILVLWNPLNIMGP
jgi:hypothetical protein